MKGKMCRWRGNGANEEEDVPMKRKMCQWSGIRGHEGEDVPMKGKMCPWRGRCANIGTSSPSSAHLPLHWHLFAFIGTSSPSWVHLRLHRHIFPFMGTSSFQGHVEGGRWRDMVCFRESFREAFAGIREGPWAKNAQSIPIRFMPHLHALNLRGETSKTDPRFAYADCLREDYREASARCLRVPTRTCKYQCFRFRGVNMSSPHKNKKVPSFHKKNVAHVDFFNYPTWPAATSSEMHNPAQLFKTALIVVNCECISLQLC